MNGIRRALILLLLTVAVILGASVPALATFKDSVALTTTINTAVVAAPTSVVGHLTCASTSTMSATWVKSTTARVSGYTVSVYFSDGFVQTVQLAGTATSWSAAIDAYYVTAYSINYTVTAKTDYGWSKESGHTGTFQC